MSGLRKRVLFVHDDDPKKPLSSFFAQDIATLEKTFELEVLSIHPFARARLEALASASAWRSVARCDAIYAWFGFAAPVLAMGKLLRKPSVVMAGGSDVVYVPEIGYGMDPRRKLRYRTVLAGYRVADRILLSSKASHRDFVALQPASAHKAQPLYLGVDSQRFHPSGPKSGHVLSISYISPMSLKRKGVLTMLETARRTPEIQYRVAGMIVHEGAVNELVATAPPNVTFLGYLDDAQLLKELQSAKVYAQLSYHEGFGMALAEAMACECIPVATDRGSLPEVVGDTGYFVPVEDPAAAADAVRKAMAGNGIRGDKARQRVVDLFQPATRERELTRIMNEVMR